MKAALGKLRNLARRMGGHNIRIAGLTFILGTLVGAAATYAVVDGSSTISQSSSADYRDKGAAGISSQDDQASKLQRTKDKVASDLEANRLTKAQADLLYPKLQAAYETLRQSDGASPSSLKDKRAEWRAWAEEHDISYGYFVSLY